MQDHDSSAKLLHKPRSQRNQGPRRWQTHTHARTSTALIIIIHPSPRARTHTALHKTPQENQTSEKGTTALKQNSMHRQPDQRSMLPCQGQGSSQCTILLPMQCKAFQGPPRIADALITATMLPCAGLLWPAQASRLPWSGNQTGPLRPPGCPGLLWPPQATRLPWMSMTNLRGISPLSKRS